MISIFAIPKAFTGKSKIIQERAISSWRELGKDIEIILFGRDKGVKESAEKFHAKHIEEIETNEFGTPLLDDAFKKASDVAIHSRIAYVNADIILMPDLMDALNQIEFDEFLAVSKRFTIDFFSEETLKKIKDCNGIREHVRNEVKPDAAVAVDLFVFNKKTNFELPPFAVGRPGWDNWFIFRARQLRLPVIDMSDVVTLVHQKHDYSHVKKKKAGTKWDGPEGDRNMEFIGDRIKLFNISHANYLLTENGLKKGRRQRRPMGKWRDEMIALYPIMRWPVSCIYSVLSIVRKVIGKN